jgi:hypothetical protein
MASRQPKVTKPVPRRVGVSPPPSGPLLPLILIGCGLAGAFFAYELGQIRAGYNRLESEQRYAALQKELIALQEDNVARRKRVALLETSEKINAEAYRQVEAQLIELQARILKQQEELAFYEGIVASDQTAGLRIQDFALVAGVDDAAFSLRLVLAQALRNDREVSGYIELAVEGTRGGESLTLDLGDLAAGEDERLDFSFRYFQNLEADLVLPEGFAPQRVIVKLTPKGKAVKAVEESFAWRVKAG